MHITILIGSLRKKSYNLKVGLAVQKMFPEISFTKAEIGTIPLYNADIDDETQTEVLTLRKEVSTSDALLIISPEYNRSIPGVLKNAIDWLSTGDVSFVGKPALIMGASNGTLGTVSAQHHIRQTLAHLGCIVVGQPEVYIGKVQEKFDEEGNVIDEKTETKMKEGIKALLELTRKLQTK